MELKPVNHRLQFLLDKLGLSTRAFSEMIGEKISNTQNYFGARNSMPGADYLEKIIRHFESIKPTWLLTGEGEPLKEGFTPIQNQTTISGKKNNVAVASINHSTATLKKYTLADCEKERDSYKAQLDKTQRGIALRAHNPPPKK